MCAHDERDPGLLRLEPARLDRLAGSITRPTMQREPVLGDVLGVAEDRHRRTGSGSPARAPGRGRRRPRSGRSSRRRGRAPDPGAGTRCTACRIKLEPPRREVLGDQAGPRMEERATEPEPLDDPRAASVIRASPASPSCSSLKTNNGAGRYSAGGERNVSGNDPWSIPFLPPHVVADPHPTLTDRLPGVKARQGLASE